jgi:hypothetical protein
MEDPMASKRIILCSDGTGNSSSNLFKTNVWRLYQALDLTRPDQIAKYDDGVGTSAFKPLALLGGVFGYGLARNIRSLYMFLCRHYQPGDEIYGFGFSRGAFTIRVLTGLVASQGIITDFRDETDLRRKVARAFQDYRRTFKTRSIGRVLTEGGRAGRDAAVDVWDVLRGFRPYTRPEYILGPISASMTDAERRERQVAAIRRAGNTPADIAFVGLWDTVDAYGLPLDEMTRAIDAYFWPLTMRDRKLRSIVQRARHALALDDERNTFHPVLWTEDGRDHGKPVDQRRIVQVWFAGMHSNVGGGYPIDSLSHVALNWMIGEIDEQQARPGAGAGGLGFFPERLAEYQRTADPLGPIYDSRAGAGAYYRYQPRRFELLGRDPPPAMWASLRTAIWASFRPTGPAPLHQLPSEARPTGDFELGSPILHHSVVARLYSGIGNYAPFILPDGAQVLDAANTVRPLDDYLAATGLSEGAANAPRLAGSAERRAHRHGIDNWVWVRRVVYFLTLFATLAFIAGPIYLGVENTGGEDRTRMSAISGIVDAIGGFLPGIARPWIDTYAANPYWFAGYAAVLLGLNALGSKLKSTINSRSGRTWRLPPPAAAEHPGTAQPGMAHPTPLPQHLGLAPRWLDRAVTRLRTARAYRSIFTWLKGHGLPALFAISFAAVGIAIPARLAFDPHATMLAPQRPELADICRSSGALEAIADRGTTARGRFDIACKAWPSGLMAQGGMRYEVVLSTAGPVPMTGLPAGCRPWDARVSWRDGSHPADAFGLATPADASLGWRARQQLFQTLALPLRRHIGQPWFAPFVKVGTEGRDEQALLPKVPPSSNTALRGVLVSEFTARRNGEIMLYVNDAVDVPMLDFYADNCGEAQVSIRPLGWDRTFNK